MGKTALPSLEFTILFCEILSVVCSIPQLSCKSNADIVTYVDPISKCSIVRKWDDL